MKLEAGRELGQYRVLRLLGSGGMADVYEAADQILSRRVALKVLPVQLSRDPNLVQRFEKEVRAAASLDHPGIVTIYEVGQSEGIYYFTMRLLPGGDLRDRIRKGLTEFQALELLMEVLDAFDHAHERGFVHRDVKPENIVFDDRGRPVLTDFGIAKAMAASDKLTATGVALGTPRYISPEQGRGHNVDHRADIYSLGVILFEMLTGTRPYDGNDAFTIILDHVTKPIPRLPAALEKYQDLIDRMMAKEPNQRPSSCGELQELLEPYLQVRTVTGRSRSRPNLPRVEIERHVTGSQWQRETGPQFWPDAGSRTPAQPTTRTGEARQSVVSGPIPPSAGVTVPPWWRRLATLNPSTRRHRNASFRDETVFIPWETSSGSSHAAPGNLKQISGRTWFRYGVIAVLFAIVLIGTVVFWLLPRIKS